MNRFLLSILALTGAVIGGFGVGQLISGRDVKQPPVPPIAWTDSLYDLHTVRLERPLLPTAVSRLATLLGEGPAILIVLNGVDLQNCGDLGRQIRELMRAVGPGIPILVTANHTSRDQLEWFLRSERLTPGIIRIGFGELWGSQQSLPTPAAVWLNAEMKYGYGVGHILRYPYVRERSFAAELSPLFTPILEDRRDTAMRQGIEVSAATFRHDFVSKEEEYADEEK